MCWKYLVPMSFAAVAFVGVWMLVVHAVPALAMVMHAIMFVLGAVVAVLFVYRTAQNIRDTGDKFDFTSNW
jgi:membrane protein implicated in regulation of membrane protease activity